jgi:hypothetical protein
MFSTENGQKDDNVFLGRTEYDAPDVDGVVYSDSFHIVEILTIEIISKYTDFRKRKIF